MMIDLYYGWLWWWHRFNFFWPREKWIHYPLDLLLYSFDLNTSPPRAGDMAEVEQCRTYNRQINWVRINTVKNEGICLEIWKVKIHTFRVLLLSLHFHFLFLQFCQNHPAFLLCKAARGCFTYQWNAGRTSSNATSQVGGGLTLIDAPWEIQHFGAQNNGDLNYNSLVGVSMDVHVCCHVYVKIHRPCVSRTRSATSSSSI